jgi:muramoyltetrapeptide carboxypeptidase
LRPARKSASRRVAVPAFSPVERLDELAKIPYSRIHHMQKPIKPPALRPGDAIRVLSLSSPINEECLQRGCEEIARLGFVAKEDRPSLLARDGFFAGSTIARRTALEDALSDPETRAIFCSRGGYGANYLLDGLRADAGSPKILLGASDITSLQIYLWQKFGWVSFYGPMAAVNLNQGPGAAHGYIRASLLRALTETKSGWPIDLQGEAMVAGEAQGILLGGCLTLVEATLGTPWELGTEGAILLLEDRGMKPYQVDRALMHLKQAGKFKAVKGIVLGEFPDCAATAGDETVQDVARRVLAPLNLPIVWGAPVGHTARPALTLPLGVRAELSSADRGTLRILEPACAP